ncbi:MAG: PAS domain S-box protein [Aggregatilineaceae bacterium]
MTATDPSLSSDEMRQLRQALLEAEQHYEALFHGAFDAILIEDSEERILDANPAACRMLGYTRDELCTMSTAQLQAPQHRTRVPNPIYQQALAGQREGTRLSTELVRRDGSVFPVDVTITPLYLQRGLVFVDILRDMSERQQAEQALAEERNLLRTLIDLLPDYVYFKDRDGRYRLLNKASQALLGVASEAEVVGKVPEDFFAAELASEYRTMDQQVLEEAQSFFNVEQAVTDHTGATHTVLMTKIPLLDSAGEVQGLVAIARDITERKQFETTLSHYAARLNVLHTLQQGVLAGQPAHEVAMVALQGFCHLVPCWSASLALFDPERDEVLMVMVGEHGETVFNAGERVPLSQFNIPDNVRRRRHAIVDDVTTLPAPSVLQRRMAAYGARAYLSTPLVVGDQVLGELALGERQAGAFGAAHRVIATQLADQLAIALSHIRLSHQVRRHTEELQRRVAERTQELERTRSRVEAILNNSSDAILLVRSTGTISQTNLTFDRLFGYQPDELFDQPLTRVAHPESVAHFAQAIEQVARQGVVEQLEIVAQRKDGSTFDAEVGLSRIPAVVGQRGGLVCHLRDITERKRAESALLESEIRYRGLFEHAPVSLWEEDFSRVRARIDALRAQGVTDFRRYFAEHPEAIQTCAAEARILQVNQATLDLFELDSYDDLRATLADLAYDPQQHLLHEQVIALAEGQTRHESEQTFVTRTGRTVHTVVGLSIPPGSEETWARILVYVIDITERKRAEEELRKALEKERELSDLKTRFVSMASHEFRTPLTTIVSSTEILERYFDRLEPDQKAKHFQRVRAASHHMTQLLDEVLLLGRAEADQLQFRPQQIDIVALAQEVLEQVQPGAAPGVRFEESFQCPQPVLWLDEKLMRHILTNLLSNAVKYSPQGGTVRFMLACTGQELLIRVQDEGIGIPPKDLEHLFEPFHRGENVGTIQGTGLGLAITKRAVDLHGGTIVCESVVGAGTTFTVRIPWQGRMSPGEQDRDQDIGD